MTGMRDRSHPRPPWYGPAWLVVVVTLAVWTALFVDFVLVR